MVESSKTSKDVLQQELEQLDSNNSSQNYLNTESADGNKDGTLSEESDQSLSNIHTGSSSEHEDVQLKNETTEDLNKISSTEEVLVETSQSRDAFAAEFNTGGEDLDAASSGAQTLSSDLRENNRIDTENNDPSVAPLLEGTDSSDASNNDRETPVGQTQTASTANSADTIVSQQNNAPEAVALDDNSIAEDAAIGDVVGTVSATDPEGGSLSYSLSDDAGGAFTIDANTGEIKVAAGLDHETTDSYTVTVDVSDGTNVTQETFTLDVGDVDEAAHSVALDDNAIAEDAAVGDVVGTVSATDPESGSLSYSLSDDAGGVFTIDANTGEIKVAAGLDHETTDSYTVTVDVSDGTNVTQETFTLDVGDVDEAAHSVALDDNAIAEDAAVGDVVGTVSATDPESGSLSYSLSDDAGGAFTIDANTGEIKVAAGLDHETTDSYTVTVDVSDGTNVTQETFTLDVGDVDEAAHSVALDDNSIAEDAAVGDVVGTVSATDPESGSLSYSLSDDAGGAFTIDANTGEIKVAAGLDHETTDSYTVTVDVSDGTNVTQETFTLNVGDVDEAAHSVALDDNSIAEDAAVGDVVGTVSATDPESGSLSYSLSDDAGGAFTIDANTGEIKVAAGLDHETTESYTVTVDVSDGTNVTQETFTLDVGDVDEAAHSVALDDNSIAEDAAVGDVVGTVSATDPEGGSLSYSLSDDAGGAFTIDTNTGEIKVAAGLDHETTDSYTVTVDVSDGTNVTQETFTLDVGDVNEGPVAADIDLGSTNEDTDINFTAADLLTNSSDVDGDALSITGVSVDASFGTVTETTPGNYTFSPTDDYSGNDIPLTFTVSDGEFTDTATATLDIAAISDTPDLSVTLGDATTSTVSGNTSSLTIDASNISETSSGFTVEARIINDDGTLSEASSDNVEAGDTYFSVSGTNDGANFQIGTNDDISEELIVSLDGTTTSINVGFDYLTGNSGGNGHEEEAFYTLYLDGVEVNSGSFVNTGSGKTGTVTITADDGSQFDQIVFSAAPDLTEANDGVGHSDYVLTSLDFDLSTPDTPVHVYNIDISASSSDQDGSETLSAVTISGVPDDATLSAGTDQGDGSWIVAEADLDGLTLIVPADGNTDFDISVSVSAADGAAASAQESASLTISPLDAAVHSVALDDNAIAEDAAIGDVVGTVSATDPESGSLSYSLSDDAGGTFTIDATTGEIKVATGLDHETTDSYTVTVDVSDGTNVTQETFTLDVGDVDEAAHSVALDDNSIAEDAAVGDVVGTVSATDPEGGSLSYSLSDDAGGAFTIDANTGEIKVAAGLDYETTTNHSVTVDVSDGTNVTQETFTINVSDVAEAIIPVDDPGLSSSANIIGTSGDDKDGTEGDLEGSDGVNDTIYGYAGDDKLEGNQGEDVLVGGEGSDTLEGGDDADSLFGGSGDDVIYGDKISGSSPDANDTLVGGDGADKLYGGSGDDVLFGGAGDDEVYGNDGADIFYFSSDEGNDKFFGGDGGGWSDTIVLTDGMPSGDINSWLTLDSGSIQSSADGEIFLSDDASGTIDLGDVQLTFEGVEKIEG